MALLNPKAPLNLTSAKTSSAFVSARTIISSAIRTSSDSLASSSNSTASKGETRVSVNAEFAYSSNLVSGERNSSNIASFDQNQINNAVQSFAQNFATPGAASAGYNAAAASGSKSSWLGGGASELQDSNSSKAAESAGSNAELFEAAARNGETGPQLPDLPEKHVDLGDDRLVPNPDGVKLTQSEFDTIRLTNALREKAGKDPLIVKDTIMETADLSSDRMKARSQMVHGLTSGWRGENIAYGQRSAEEVVNAWKNSPGHYANMMGNYKYIGVGDTKEREGSIYWTQQFI